MRLGRINDYPKICRWTLFIPKGATRVIIVTPWITIWFAPKWFMFTWSQTWYPGRKPRKFTWDLVETK